MKKRFGKYTLRLLPLVLAAVISLCSCGSIVNTASDIASAVISSAGDEISGAVSEGMEDFSDGINDIKEGLSEASSGLNEAGGIISEKIENIGSKVSDGLNDVSDDIKNAVSQASDKVNDIAENIGSELSDAKERLTPETSASSDDTTRSPAEKKHYEFRNKARYDEHYEKHGSEFGNITKEEYLELANELINSDSDSILHKTADNGDRKFYDPDKNYFLVLSEDGYIRTFFMPTAGMKYWERQ